MLEVVGLEVRYGAVQAVLGLDLKVAAGEIVVLIGANGAGKSSVVNAVAGLVPQAAGAVRLGGANITQVAAPDRVRQGLALVIEGRGVFADMTVHENLELGTYAHAQRRRSVTRQAAVARVVGLFPRLGERMGQMAGTLSGGEQQMLVIGRALMGGPSLLLLDEPSLGLAPLIVEEISSTLKRLAKEEGVAVLVAEQNAVVGLNLADRGYVLQNGRVVLHRPCADLRHDSDLLRLYLGGPVEAGR
jgi:branched-chain amino acid transport system ATP-binding protein